MKQFTNIVITATLCLVILAGLVLVGIEFSHEIRDPGHQFETTKWLIGIAAMVFPALALQKGTIKGALDDAIEIFPLAGAIRARVGRRATDPVIVVPDPDIPPGGQPDDDLGGTMEPPDAQARTRDD